MSVDLIYYNVKKEIILGDKINEKESFNNVNFFMRSDHDRRTCVL